MDQAWELNISLLFAFHVLELSLMATYNCKGGWEIIQPLLEVEENMDFNEHLAHNDMS